MKVNRGFPKVLGTFLIVALLTAACGSEEGSPTTGAGTEEADLSGASFTVGSKEFTEQLVLGQITLQALEAAGATVDDKTGLPGSVQARTALEGGQIDMYWEYTGTGWITYLKHTKPIDDPQGQYEAVAKEDMKKNDIAWLPPAPADNTYAIAASEETLEEDGVSKISDLPGLIKEDPEASSLCVGTEFAVRDDGLPGIEKHYGFQWPTDQIAKVTEGVIYSEIDKSKTCAYGEVFATDGRIAGLDLAVLEDDKQFFAIYNPSLTVNGKAFDKYGPELEKIFAPIADKLDTETLQKLNSQVDVDGLPEEAVAEQWLTEEGLI
ncbi:MAG: glycine betaine ABC transporter substrate-binding protein [Actinomycetota bacterium]|nr:glycine betaine ABC transporter substrate-binding protein [Actinomycetota bacterium]